MTYEKKTDWQFDDVVTEKDANRWEKGIDDAHKHIDDHVQDQANPHHVTKEQVGLGNVQNYSLDDIQLDDERGLFKGAVTKNLGSASTEFEAGVPFYILLARNDTQSRTLGILSGARGTASSNYDAGLYLVQISTGASSDGASIITMESRTRDEASTELVKLTYDNKRYIALKMIRDQFTRFDMTLFQGMSTHLDEMRVVEADSVTDQESYDGGNAQDIAILGANSLTVDNELLAKQKDLNNHTSDRGNPHKVTKAQVGLANVDNVKQVSKQEFDSHIDDTNNPHGTTAGQVGAIPTSGGSLTGSLQFRPQQGGGLVRATIHSDGSISSLEPFDFVDGLTSRGHIVDAIVDQGNNTNGNYIRYESGFQICWGIPFTVGNYTLVNTNDPNLWRSDTMPWTYPATFNDNHDIVVVAGHNGINRLAGAAGTTSGGFVNLRGYYFGRNPSGAISIRPIAIGRWK
ncbi:hypothetical protein [Amphibacillus sediminis]|uniref:hypothetical protein n=1 Tax=Amphibacillus sediminis TaxID=360185 RepID=UPI00083650D5